MVELIAPEFASFSQPNVNISDEMKPKFLRQKLMRLSTFPIKNELRPKLPLVSDDTAPFNLRLLHNRTW